MEKIAIIGPTSINKDILPKRIRDFTSKESVRHASYLSNMGTHLDINNTRKNPAHIYAPLNPSFTKAFVVREFPVLYANDFTVCWLGKMLADMGKNSELYIEIENEKVNKNKHNITADFLRAKLRSVVIDYVNKKWMRLPYSDGLLSDIESLHTIYKTFHNKFEEFRDIFTSSSDKVGTDEKRLRAEVTRTYIYSLFGANQKGFVIDRIIQDYFSGASIEGIDLGGGYGFMAAELAAAGHTLTMVDYKERNVNIAKWLVKECDLEDKLTVRVGNIEDVSSLTGQYDLVSYFGCLLYVDRHEIPDIFRASMRLLKPGGFLLIHENPKEAGKPGTQDYEERFEADELKRYMVENAGTPEFYNMFTGKKVPWESIRHKLIMAMIRKN